MHEKLGFRNSTFILKDDVTGEVPWEDCPGQPRVSFVLRLTKETSGIKVVSFDNLTGANLVPWSEHSKLKHVGRGRIRIGSGAGASVCPIDVLSGEPLYHTRKVGARYRVAVGQPMLNKGEKRVTFDCNGVVGLIHVQGIDEVSKTLASAASIVSRGSRKVMEDDVSSYIGNKNEDTYTHFCGAWSVCHGCGLLVGRWRWAIRHLFRGVFESWWA